MGKAKEVAERILWESGQEKEDKSDVQTFVCNKIIEFVYILFFTIFSTNLKPKILVMPNAKREPTVRPIVERITPDVFPKRKPPTTPVSSPGIGAATTCNA
jgi:hypothetical protein